MQKKLLHDNIGIRHNKLKLLKRNTIKLKVG